MIIAYQAQNQAEHYNKQISHRKRCEKEGLGGWSFSSQNEVPDGSHPRDVSF